VDEGDVHRVHAVLDPVAVAVGSDVGRRQTHEAVGIDVLQEGIPRQGWRPERSSIAAFSIAQVSKDQAEILLDRIALDLDFAGEARILGRLLDALAGGIVLPAVVEAADAVALDPARTELRAAVRAAELEQVRRVVLAAVEREVLA
jgi:hypothetical protein